MAFANIYSAIPTGTIVVIAEILALLALRFRAIVALGLTVLAFVGLSRAGDPHPFLALPFGALVYGLLSAITAIFAGRGDAGEGEQRRLGHAGDQDRIAADYHRRQRESRF